MSFFNTKLEEFNKYIKGKKVAIIGLGVSNLPLIDYLYEKEAKVTIFDNKEKDKISNEILNKIDNYNFNYFFRRKFIWKFEKFQFNIQITKCFTNKSIFIRRKQ